jgi:hypothetical protein
MSFLSRALDDKDSSVNAAHLTAFVLVMASICWVTYLVIKNSAMPDLSGVAYLLGGSGAMNVCSKAESIIAKFKKQPEAPVPDLPAPDLGKVS